MALATRCPYCQTTFRVVHDQLKLRSGMVRCGQCQHIFNGIEHLVRANSTPDSSAAKQAAAAPVPAAAPARTEAQPVPAAVAAPAPTATVSAAGVTPPTAQVNRTEPALPAPAAPAQTGVPPAVTAPAIEPPARAVSPARPADSPPSAKTIPAGIAPAAVSASAGAPTSAHRMAEDDEPLPWQDTEIEIRPEPAPWQDTETSIHPDLTSWEDTGSEIHAEPAPWQDTESGMRPEPAGNKPAAPQEHARRWPELHFEEPVPARAAEAGDARPARLSAADSKPPEAGPRAPGPASLRSAEAGTADLRAADFAANAIPAAQPSPINFSSREPQFTELHVHPRGLPETLPTASAEAEQHRIEPTFDDAGWPEHRAGLDVAGAAESLEQEVQPDVQAKQAPDADEPNFVKYGRRQQKWQRVWFWLQSFSLAFLLLLLAAQAIYTWRDIIATRWPITKAPLTQACAVVHCKVELPTQIQLLSIELGELQALPRNKNTFSYSTLLRNHSNLPQSWPSIELVLLDANDHVVARRIFSSQDYQITQQERSKGFAAQSEHAVKLYFETAPQLKAQGYRAEIFYP